MSTSTSVSGIIKIGANGQPIAEVYDYSVKTSSDTVECSVLGDDYRNYKATLQEQTFSISCYYDKNDTGGQDALLEGARVHFSVLPLGIDGEVVFAGYGVITSRSVAAKVGEMLTLDVEILGYATAVETIASYLLLESSDAFLLESSPDESGNPEFIRLES